MHIGYPKTGSSALQTTLLASRPALREHGFFFPNAPSGLCNAFTAHFHHDPETLFPYCEMPDRDERRRRMARDFEVLAERIDRQARRRVILSSESLIGLEQADVIRVRDWLMARTDLVTIICYVRHPIPYASSLIQERVKQGETLAQLADVTPTGNFSRALPKWAEVFGKDAMVVRPLERARLAGGDVVTDFAALIGYDGPLDRTQQYSNPSLSQAAVLLISAVHALPPAVREKAPSLAWLREIPGSTFRLPDRTLDLIRERSARELAYLEREWDIVFAPPDLPEATDAPAFDAASLDFLARKLVGA